MSLHDPSSSRKFRRLGLYLPFALLLIAALGWTAFWFWSRGEARTRIDAAAEALREAGYQVSWEDLGIGGYPFRVHVTLEDARIRAPSGWALQTPRLEGHAFMHGLGHWILAAPEGLTFVRPEGGPVAVKGDMIRASLTDFEALPPSLSFQGTNLKFQPGPGARPFGLTAAELVEFHLRARPGHEEAGVFLEVKAGEARLSGLLGRIAGEKPVSISWNSTVSETDAFRGADWPAAVRNWADAGGRMTVRQAGMTAGEAVIGAKSGTLSASSDGRLSGWLEVTLRQAPRALNAMGETGVIPEENAQAAAAVTEAREGADDVAGATLYFQAGRTTLGPVALGPAPKVYEPR